MRTSALMKFSPGGGTLPSTVIGPQANIWLNDSELIDPTYFTPGRLSRRSTICLYVASTNCASRYLSPLVVSSRVNTFLALNPGETLCKFAKLRISNAAPIRSNTESASSETTSDLRKLRPLPHIAPESAEARPPSLSVE